MRIAPKARKTTNIKSNDLWTVCEHDQKNIADTIKNLTDKNINKNSNDFYEKSKNLAISSKNAEANTILE